MNKLSSLRTCCILKWASVNFSKNSLIPSKTITGGTGFNRISQNPRFYGRKASVQPRTGQNSKGLSAENSSFTLSHQEAQDALIEYLHHTRNLQHVDAENISRNSPEFLEKLLEGIENGKDAEQSLRRFLRFHPINEFEPFFESIGLKPNEYSPLLPRDIMYLTDDQRLLDNYHVLCEYGIDPNKIGKIYIDAHEVFRYDHGCLLSKFNSLQAKGFAQSSVIKLVTSCPSILVNEDFLKVLDSLMNFGVVNSWFEDNILEENSYNWCNILETLCILTRFGFSNEDLRELLHKNPTILLQYSGARTISLIVFLMKFGASIDDISSMFTQFPQIKTQQFQSNLKNGYHFLLEIGMDHNNIANIICTHSAVFGSCTLKTVKTLLNGLKSGKKRICDIINKNPLELKNWVLGTKVNALPNLKNDYSQKKIIFLSNLGFGKNSKEMNKALKLFRGNGGELQERFDCLVNAGLSHEDVAEMVKLAPQIINQTKEVIEAKIDFLVNDLGYPLSSLVGFPAFLGYSIQKIKVRFAMYNWLVDRGKMNGNLALSTVVASSDRIFVRDKIGCDPEGMMVWDQFKKQYYPE